ncbi:MAG: hypothetical protein AAF589_09385, partial [Planctomycetota bacterium]
MKLAPDQSTPRDGMILSAATAPAAVVLLAATIAAAALYATILWLAPEYALATPQKERPILLVIGLYAAAFVPYWLAWGAAVRVVDDRKLL